MAAYGLPEYDAGVLTQSAALADYFEQVAAAAGNPKAASNWVMGELLRTLNDRGETIGDVPLAPRALAGLIALIDKGVISGSIAKDVFAKMYDSGRTAEDVVATDGLAQIGDESALLSIVRDVIGRHADAVAQYRAGKTATFGFLVGQAMKAMQETLDALASQRGDSPSHSSAAEQAVAALNEAAMMAAAAAKVPGRGRQGQSGEEVTEQLRQIAQQQGSVNRRTGQIPPMRLGQEARTKRLSEAAASQERIARQLNELADRPADQPQSLGDLEAMAQEAQALAERLVREILDVETLQRQERLFHRLLDAGRSLEKDEYSDERESSVPGQFERNEVEVLSAEDMGALRFQPPPAEELQRLSPAQRQMVLEYFERLNRAERRAGPRGTIR